MGIERPDARGTSSNAGVAQSVERKTLNLVVEGSSPSFGAFSFFCRWTGGGRQPLAALKRIFVVVHVHSHHPVWLAARVRGVGT